MTTLNKTASWIICNKLTGKAIFETFSRNTADTINAGGTYKAIPALEYLQSLNNAENNRTNLRKL